MESSSAFVFLIQVFVWSLSCTIIYGTPGDIQCLKTLKASLKDPNNYLSSTWNFNKNTEGFICRFNGVDCWHPDENRVLNLHLSNMGLQGKFPLGLENCSSMTGLDLSSNDLSGPIPSDISKRIPFVTSLDLSYNGFSGEIPVGLANCSYLNTLNLQHNRLTGQIPGQLVQLNRLTQFNVSDNSLSGPIPVFNASFPAFSFSNNVGLCGKPLNDCTGGPKKSRSGVIVG
ncbi:inactive leucine-rich repeat receptor-like protein kinase [Acorus calamus]|uniref:Inactive leucine-rich repeat receptor-like protein kinase n=1 Tax=Acorus calamus TaxID=4465 RepID=A0AAV9EZL1_ACOCL|nr:inactive leucine-rich repeat receptor-like protein kinase [Acorus calamus]